MKLTQASTLSSVLEEFKTTQQDYALLVSQQREALAKQQEVISVQERNLQQLVAELKDVLNKDKSCMDIDNGRRKHRPITRSNVVKHVVTAEHQPSTLSRSTSASDLSTEITDLELPKVTGSVGQTEPVRNQNYEPSQESKMLLEGCQPQVDQCVNNNSKPMDSSQTPNEYTGVVYRRKRREQKTTEASKDAKISYSKALTASRRSTTTFGSSTEKKNSSRQLRGKCGCIWVDSRRRWSQITSFPTSSQNFPMKLLCVKN